MPLDNNRQDKEPEANGREHDNNLPVLFEQVELDRQIQPPQLPTLAIVVQCRVTLLLELLELLPEADHVIEIPLQHRHGRLHVGCVPRLFDTIGEQILAAQIPRDWQLFRIHRMQHHKQLPTIDHKQSQPREKLHHSIAPVAQAQVAPIFALLRDLARGAPAEATEELWATRACALLQCCIGVPNFTSWMPFELEFDEVVEVECVGAEFPPCITELGHEADGQAVEHNVLCATGT
mmetsp:Transcript_111783/g.323077  ORF Transcript_111783/g.323077 Transcript_111783/m.323077 type:complete len:235 (+) Transcript_111783:124-828(+)